LSIVQNVNVILKIKENFFSFKLWYIEHQDLGPKLWGKAGSGSKSRTLYDENGSATLEIESADFMLREGGKERVAS
jgi:hypothetical protein